MTTRCVRICVAVLCAAVWCGCGQSRDDDAGFVERTNRQMGKSAVDYVRKPLAKARKVDEAAQHRQTMPADSDEPAAE